MKRLFITFSICILVIGNGFLKSQDIADSKLLTIDRIFNSNEFTQERPPVVQWIENGASYVRVEKSANTEGAYELVKYSVDPYRRTIFVSAESLTVNSKPIVIENFTLSGDGSKVLIFTNSSRVWRTNTKGDFWVYDLAANSLRQIGKQFKSSSLMFAKFDPGNKYVAYVHDFNIYIEDFESGVVIVRKEFKL